MKCAYWIFERIRYILIVDCWHGACEKAFLYWYNVWYIMFGECCLICMWLALNNLFGRVLVYPLLLAICLFVHKVEKEDYCPREKQENCEHLWYAISNCFKKYLFTPSLGVIHKWDSSSKRITENKPITNYLKKNKPQFQHYIINIKNKWIMENKPTTNHSKKVTLQYFFSNSCALPFNPLNGTSSSLKLWRTSPPQRCSHDSSQNLSNQEVATLFVVSSKKVPLVSFKKSPFSPRKFAVGSLENLNPRKISPISYVSICVQTLYPYKIIFYGRLSRKRIFSKNKK